MTTRVDAGFGAWQVSWALVAALVAVASALTFDRYADALEATYLVWYVGFLAGVDVFAPPHAAPERWRRIRWVVLAGLVVTAAIVARRVVVLV